MSHSEHIREISSILSCIMEPLTRMKRDKAYEPTPEDIMELDAIAQKLHHAYATAGYIERCMGQRLRGEPEGSKKFTDPEVFDYHYPA